MQYWKKDIINNIRLGFYSAEYFNRTKNILLGEKNLAQATMQIFQKQQNVVLCGITPVKELLKAASGFFDNKIWIEKGSELTIESLKDGDIINNSETIMHIIGSYAYFAHLESLYLGILARATKIATNTQQVVVAANKKPVIFFADRFDYFLCQELDGYAANLGGAFGVATKAQTFYFNGQPMGTIPHALIAINNGDSIKATEQFLHYYPKIPLIALVDFDNDCVNTSIEIAKKLEKKLYAVRLDTSKNMIDKSIRSSLQGEKIADDVYGVNPILVKNVRSALDQNGFEYVKIVVSGGFNKEKIKMFEKENVPVDIYGVGSSLLKGSIDFTADIVKVEHNFVAKEGRSFKEIIKR